MSNKNQFKTINQVEKFLAKKGLELTQTNIEKYFDVGWWDNTINQNVYLSIKIGKKPKPILFVWIRKVTFFLKN
jgi:hypothetical protein